MFLVGHSMVFIFLNLFALLECPIHVDDLKTRHKALKAKLLTQGYRYHKLIRRSQIVSKNIMLD